MKFAVIVLLEFMVTVTGLAVPVMSPLHPVKVYPEFAVAVSWTEVPDA